MTLGEVLAAGEAVPEAIPESGGQEDPFVVDSDSEEEVSEAESEVESEVETAEKVAPESPQITTRSGRIIKKNRRYQ